jgi:anti-sigma factor RsiW
VVCDDNSRLLHGYLDGELDLVRSLEIEEHLKTCPDCAQQLWGQQTLRKAFRSSNLYERAPSGLAVRIRASLSQEVEREADAASQPKPISILTPRLKVWNWLAVAATILLAALLTWRALPGVASARSSVRRAIHRPAHRETVVQWQARFLAARSRLNGRRIPSDRRASRLH